MLEKKFTPKRTVCKVTFSIPSEWAEKEVTIAGDFNDWDPSATKLEKKNGSWKTELRLKPSTEYQYKYFCDGEEWKNDDAADAYVTNEFGTENSLLVVGE